MMSSRYEEGLRVRTEVLGSEYVERSLADATDFNIELQQYLTEFCWGTVWQSERIDRRTRSLVTIAVLATRGSWTELRTHVRGALRNGCTVEEIGEVLRHLAVYAGAPTAVEGFRNADVAVKEWRDEEDR